MTYLPIDWVAAALGLAGMWLLPTQSPLRPPRGKRASIVLFLLGNAIWLAWAFQMGAWGVAANYIIMGALNARTLIKWVGDDRRDERAVKLQLQGAS